MTADQSANDTESSNEDAILFHVEAVHGFQFDDAHKNRHE